MRRTLPPLTALRAFEAAARTMSFTKAAEELRVTQGAVSRQIRLLEEVLGVPLFIRLTRKVELTVEGDDYRRAVARAFDEVELATARLQGGARRQVLRISVLPTISSYWLMPLLAAFSQGDTEAELRVISSIEPVDFRGRSADLAIRVGRVPGESFGPDNPRIELDMVTDWRGVRSDLLFPDVLTPVCSRDLLAESGPLTHVDDFGRHKLIHVTTRRHAWHDWLRAHRATIDPDANAMYFGHFFMAMEAARSRQGIALVPSILLRHYEGANEIVAPLPADIPSAGNYRLLYHESSMSDPQAVRFRQWLIREAAAEREAMMLGASR